MQRSYTLGELAKFLHRSEKEIERLASSGTLRGRKLKGDWIFSLPDVVLWMESEMIQVDSQQTVILEDAVGSSSDDENYSISLSNILDIDSIELSFSAKTKVSVINEIVKLGERVGKLWDPVEMARELKEREEMNSTAIDSGVAILHPRRPQPNIISEDFLALAVSRTPIPFGGGFNNNTDVFFLLCCQTDTSYLRTLGKLARVLKSQGFLDNLRECDAPVSVLELLEKTENELE